MPAAAKACVGSSATAIVAREAAPHFFPPPLRGRVREGGVHDIEGAAPPRPSPIEGEGEVLRARLREAGRFISRSLCEARVDEPAVLGDERAFDDLVVPIDF